MSVVLRITTKRRWLMIDRKRRQRQKSGLKMVVVSRAAKTYQCGLPRFLRKPCSHEIDEVVRRGWPYVRIQYDTEASAKGSFSRRRAMVYAINLACYRRLEKTCKWPALCQLPGYRDSYSQKELQLD